MAVNINREILRLSGPAIVSNLTVPLLGLSDTVITGHLGDEAYIGAIAVGSMLLNAVYWLFGFLRMGTTGLTALAYGADDHRACLVILVQALLVAVGAGMLFIVAREPLFSVLSVVMGASDGVRSLAAEYFSICIWAAPAQLSTMCVLGWFLGMQDTVRPMVISVGLNVMNIGISIFLVVFAGFGFRGVAYGTLIANWCALILAVVLFERFKRVRRVRLPMREVLDFRRLRRFFTVNANIFFRSACIMSVTVAVTAIGARIGDTALAANAVLMQFFLFFSYFMDGLAFTGEALAGRYAGARDSDMLKASTNRLMGWAAFMAGAFFVGYVFFHRPIIELITDVPTVVAYAESMRLWIVLMPPLTVGAFIFDGFYIGLTATGRMLCATLASTVIFFAMALIDVGGSTMWGVPGNGRLWTAFLAYLFCRGFFLGLWWPSTRSLSVAAPKT